MSIYLDYNSSAPIDGRVLDVMSTKILLEMRIVERMIMERVHEK